MIRTARHYLALQHLAIDFGAIAQNVADVGSLSSLSQLKNRQAVACFLCVDANGRDLCGWASQEIALPDQIQIRTPIR